MSTFFATEHLLKLGTKPVVPWEFTPVQTVPEDARTNKKARQTWLANPDTVWQYYSGIEGAAQTLRVSKENPPAAIHAAVADYDVKIPDERANEAIARMTHKPTRKERSLGGNLRLIWEFERPIFTNNDPDFCAHILAELHKYLELDLLPGLDENAWNTASRLYANGAKWEATGHQPLAFAGLQAFFVKIAKDYKARPNADVEIPLDVAEKLLKEKYPNFSWPSDFTLESQGPTFWIPGSESAASAIVKANGIFTFAAHAPKSFYSWAELVGKEAIEKYQDAALADATAEVYWDTQNAWRRINGIYSPMGAGEFHTFLSVGCRLSEKPGKDGRSPLKKAEFHIHENNRIAFAGPFCFRPQGIVTFQNIRVLNTYNRKPITPAEGKQEWGPQGNFPFISLLLSLLFEPLYPQLNYFLGWLQHYYRAAFYNNPMPGQNIFLMGGAGIGKTLTNRQIIGMLVGGFTDASDFLVAGESFNSHLLSIPHWCLDDDAPSMHPHAQARFHAQFKKIAANQQFQHKEKFEKSGMVEWCGRIGATTNLDLVSVRLVGPLDDNSRDKVNLFRCPASIDMVFPPRDELAKTLEGELPCFGRYVLDWKMPETVRYDSRYGIWSFQEATLLDRSAQSSGAAPIKEVLIETLIEFFRLNKEEKIWKGSAHQLLRLIMTTACNEFVFKSLKIEQVNRYLEMIQREGVVKCTVTTGALTVREWTFKREDFGL